MSTPLHPSELRSRVFCAVANGKSPSIIAETLNVPLEQVEPLIAEYNAERRERMLARFKPTATPITVDATKPLVIPVVEVPKPPTAVELRIEERRRRQEAIAAERDAKVAEKQAKAARSVANVAKAAAEARRRKVHDGFGCPTAEQIQSACELIQAGWSDHERRSRWLRAHSVDGIEGLVGSAGGLEISLVAVRDIVAAA